MAPRQLTKWFPWVQHPAISNAPMFGVASAALAAEVSKAGGFGFLSCAVDVSENSPHLAKLDADLTECRQQQEQAGVSGRQVFVGAGFLTCHPSITQFSTTVLPILKRHPPAAVWLFAPDAQLKPHRQIIRDLKTLDDPPKVFVQVGNVAAAREAVEDGADAVVCQGIDAGGHQFRRGMGVVSFVPEVTTMLAEEFGGKEIAVLAAGGIVDGRGAAAALALGAEGIVMGTRFTVSPESVYPEFRKEIVLQTRDGGSTTLKSEFNDEITNSPLWGHLYDGRAIMGPIHAKFLSGATLQECQKLLQEGYSPEESMKLINTWAGTGVGLVTKAQPAGEVVREVRREAKQTIRALVDSL
ncbi:hypothetical protein S7711_07082 [Stachybotrys chartarum IBT 7711]|uniref:Uncharacterized protein n=1 Tax=Stachybotrys chartarum (strain CBS 109288 / IBT 7711) TaxID=1280523 RepID=A0A084AP78_STACB|nr:hypothetical protein S7711_07082 [Stachybotrys chartarum IBT 7711]KFA52098.1 hypothetical protein S40293_02914 [Stachybotrys chartarum IBT 40293]